jgi:hypothetical protein
VKRWKKTARETVSAATRAFRDAMRDIVAEEGWFELELEGAGQDWRARRAWLQSLSPNPTA